MKIAVIGNKHYLIQNRISNILNKYNATVEYLDSHKKFSEDYDMAFALGYYKLIPEKYFNLPKHGTYVVHASDLPKGRGWAPVNWALINDEKEIVITSIKVDAGCDTGPYHLKTKISIEPYDTYHTTYEKVDQEIVKHVASIISSIGDKKLVLNKQEGEPTYYPRRTAVDSELDPDKSLKEQWNLIRATDNVNYPAFFKLHGKKIILRYEVVDETE